MSQKLPTPGSVARIVEKQLRNWELSRRQRLSRPIHQVSTVADFIALANIVGAGGSEVASLLSDELGWPVFDRQILTAMAGDDELRARLYKSMDERDLGWLENTFRSLGDREFCKNDYFRRLCETLFCLARKGPSIFVGRSADLILPPDRGLRVKVVASPERCAANFARRTGVSMHDARKAVAKIEQDRRDFIRNHFHMDAYEPTRFDLIVNVERFTARQAVDLILAAHRLRIRSEEQAAEPRRAGD